MVRSRLEISAVETLANVNAREWDMCACPEAMTGRPRDPFTTHRFLYALERSGSVGGNTGWQPRHLLVRDNGRLIASAPLYIKSHSQGEYIFDHAFADAWQRAGGPYYPKLQVAVPFTPATGRRFLVAQGYERIGRAALLDALKEATEAHRLSSVHVTFCTEDEAKAGVDAGFLHRVTEQFHWENDGFSCFDDYIGALSSRKRKAIRRERATANGFGGRIVALTGDDLQPEHWQAFWLFYQDTGARKWGRPYLTRDFFDLAQEHLRHDVLLILAERGGRWVAGALNFIGSDALYGRYWGAVEDHSCLHFELCYYRAIEYALDHGLTRVEAGAQGAHKLARGYLPKAIHSLHHFPHARFRDAVASYLDAEREAVAQEMGILTAAGPFRRTTHRLEDEPDQ